MHAAPKAAAVPPATKVLPEQVKPATYDDPLHIMLVTGVVHIEPALQYSEPDTLPGEHAPPTTAVALPEQ